MSQPLLMLIPILLVSSLILFLVWRMRQAMIAAWAEFASRHGLSAKGLLIEGTYKGYPMRLEARPRPSGKHRHLFILLSLSIREALPANFSLEREDLKDKVRKLLGKGDSEIGDEQFDRSFELKNLSPEVTQVLRNEAVQQLLYEMVKHYGPFHIRGGWIQAEHRQVPSTADAVEEFIGPALMLARKLEEAARRAKSRTMG